MKIEKYIRKPFPVNAVRITRDNIEEVAKWCGGKVEVWKGRARGKIVEKPFIKMDVSHAISTRQTEGRIGDWILERDGEFKSYTDAAFQRIFEPVLKIESATEAIAAMGRAVQNALEKGKIVAGDEVEIKDVFFARKPENEDDLV